MEMYVYSRPFAARTRRHSRCGIRYGSDHGMCEDEVFKALCAHTCMPFFEANLGGKTQYDLSPQPTTKVRD